MANPEANRALPTDDPASLDAAVQATESALPFIEWLMQRFNKIGHDLRSGDDKDGLEQIEGIAKDLEDFFQYTFLISDMCAPSGESNDLAAQLEAYRNKLKSILESINPALDNLDLVEVADIIEHEILPALVEYAPIHDTISSSLAAAA